MVDVHFFSNVRALTNQSRVTLSLPNKSSILDLLEFLVEKHSKAFKDYIFTDEGRLSNYVAIIINGRGINTLDRLETILHYGDSIAILPVVGGG